jgi:predicted small secreted protein
MKKIILLMLIALLVTISTIGCNAARGVGKDIQDTGKHVSNIGN